MATISDALIEALKGKEEVPAGAVADTWYTLGLTTHRIDALLVAQFLLQKGIVTRFPWDVQREHLWNYGLTPDHEKYLDSEGVPKAPVSLEKILQTVKDHLAVRRFGEEGRALLENQRLTKTDKFVALETRIIAQNFDHCYVITNDTDLIRQITRMKAEQGLDITLLMPSTIEQNLSHLLPSLGLRLLVPGNVLAQLYKIGSSGQSYQGQPYVSVKRKVPHTLGNTTITADTATSALFTDDKVRRVPARTKDYGIPVLVVKDSTDQTVVEALRGYAPRLRQLAKVKLIAALPQTEKHFPIFLRITQVKESIYLHRIRWARI